MNNSVRKITDASMMVAIVTLVFILNRQFAGILEAFMTALLPIPLVFYSAKYGFKDGLLPLAGTIIMAVIFGTPTSIFYACTMSFSGLLIGNGVKKGDSSLKILLVAIIAAVIADLVTMVLFAGIFGYDITEEIVIWNELLEPLNMSANQNGSLVKYLIILSTVLTGIMEGIITYFLSITLLKRFKFTIRKIKPLNEIVPVKWTGYVGIALFIAQLLVIPLENSVFKDIVIVIGILGSIYLVAFGCIAVIVFGAKEFKKNLAPWLLIGIIFLNLFAIITLAFIGFLYITTDLRNRLLERK